VSTGAVLALVALTLAVIIAGLFRLVAVLDSTELSLRRLVAGVRAARRTVEAAAGLAAAVGQDAASGQAALDRLQDLKRGRSDSARPGGERGAGPVSLPLRPGRSPR
jgi:ABC-type multidrug transport system fused ATPase/permease subunit